MFKQYPINQELLLQAKTWSNFKGNKYTISKSEEDQIGGSLGEIIFQKIYPDAERISDIDKQADFIKKGYRIDVKTTIHKYAPRTSYYAHINEHQKDFIVDFYYFFWYDCLNKIIYDLGIISKSDFYSNALFYKIGDYFPNSTKQMEESIYRLSLNNLVR